MKISQIISVPICITEGIASESVTISSLDFLHNIINPSREAAGENPVRPSDFHARVNDEIDDILNYDNFVVGKTGHKTNYTMLSVEQMTLVGMRESKAVRRIVLEKLKSLTTTAIPQTLPEALRLAADLAEDKQRLEIQVSEMKPAVEAFERIAAADGSLCITDAAKNLQVRPKELFTQLSSQGWIYRRLGNAAWTAYEDKLKQGMLEHKVTTISMPDGTEKVQTQVRITPKGLTKLSNLVGGRHG